jgi:hypothetical protein
MKLTAFILLIKMVFIIPDTFQNEQSKSLWNDHFAAIHNWWIFQAAKFYKLQNYQTELIIFIGSSIENTLTQDEQDSIDMAGFELVDQIKIDEAKQKLYDVNHMIHIENQTFTQLPKLNREEEEYIMKLRDNSFEDLNARIEQADILVRQTYIAANEYLHDSSSSIEPDAKRVMYSMN